VTCTNSTITGAVGSSGPRPRSFGPCARLRGRSSRRSPLRS
jgi:hypothetical protein